MELLQLHYFQTVAETQNITKAARQLFITQPALSAAIARLEKDIGIPLFARSSNRITLTEAGRCFLEHVNSAFSLLDEGVAQAKQIANRHRRQLRIAAAFGMMRDIKTEYSAAHPSQEIELTICDTEEILSLLTNGEADFGLSLGSIPDSRFTNRVLMESRYFIAVSEDDPLSQRESVTLRDLEGTMLFCSNIAQTYERAQDIFHRAGCSCNLLRLDEKDVLFEAARKGLGGVFCVPMISSHNKLFNGSDPGVVFLPIRDCTEKGQVVLVMRKDSYFTAETEEFISFLSKRFYTIEETTRQELLNRGVDPDV